MKRVGSCGEHGEAKDRKDENHGSPRMHTVVSCMSSRPCCIATLCACSRSALNSSDGFLNEDEDKAVRQETRR
jgi:hypothetical protein